ncbi:MAG TPA: PilZ domain-containing protein, partial [Kofleriaceae bacterium]
MTFDRRRSARVLSSGELRLEARDHRCHGRLLDVSSHGARFCGTDLPPAGTRVRVQLSVPCHRLRLTGSIVRNAKLRAPDSESAVEFDPLTREERVALNNALLELAPPRHVTHGTILLMIDEPDAQLSIGKALHDHGYFVISRTTRLDVVRHFLEGAGPPLRAALVSESLPFGAGQDVLDYLATERPHVKRGLLIDAEHAEHARCWASRPDFVVVRP